MKNQILLLSIIILFSVQIGVSQKTVLDIHELPYIPDARIIPDVDNKVLVVDDLITSPAEQIITSGFTPYPNWPISVNGSSQRGGVYCNLDDDDDLEIVYCVTQEVYAWNPDGTIVDGWPQSVLQYPDGAPAFGDITGDGVGEIVVSSRQAGTGNTGTLTAFHLDGSLVDGFPVSMTGGATKTPVLADLNGDGINEIIVEERAWPDGYVGVFKGDGTYYPGFPVILDYIPGSAVAVGDITGDNIPEIVAESYYSIYAFDINGNVLDGFPFIPGTDRVFSYSSPVLADLDGDGLREILAGDHSLALGNGAVHALKSDGTVLEGWPKYTAHWIYGPPAVGDIDGDGELDVAVGDQVLAGSPSNRVYAWDKNGNNLPGWPSPFINAINNQILLADLDGDNMVELMWDDNTGNNVYIGYNHDGTPMDGWPISLNGSSFFMNPFAVDINNDGILDVSGASGNLTTNVLDFYLWNTNVPVDPVNSPLTILQYNVQHTGVYLDPLALNAAFSASDVDICEGNQVQFTDESMGSIIDWEWTFEGGEPGTSTDQNPLVTYPVAGIFDVSLTVSDGTTSSSVAWSDFIKVAYEPEIPGIPSGPANFSTDTTTFTIYETSAANADDYIWELTPEDVGVLTAGDTITQIKIYWSNDPDYFAELRVKNENECGESEFSDPLMIYVNWTVGLPAAAEKKPFLVYPNPSGGKVFIRFDKDVTPAHVFLYNTQAQRIAVENPQDHTDLIALDPLSPGIYLLRIETETERYYEKIIVR